MVRATLGDLQVQQRVDLAAQPLETRQRVGRTEARREQDGGPQATGLRPDHGAGRDAICTTAGVSVP